MTCSDCNHKSTSVRVIGAVPEWTTTVAEVTGMDGNRYALNQPLFPPSHFPRRDYTATIMIADIPATISGSTATAVFNEAMRLHTLNKRPFWFVNIWLNLNLQWIPKVPTRYQTVTVEQLYAISTQVR